MNNIKTILIPIQFDAEHLSAVKQAAIFAQEHNAVIHLLVVNPASRAYNFSQSPRSVPVKNIFDLGQEQAAMLATWKRWVEQYYCIKVIPVIETGNWKKVVLQYSDGIKADLLVLKNKPEKKKWFSFRKSPVEYLIAKSRCQVLTLYTDKKSIAEWKEVVIPITDFIPEQRIHAIIKLARAFKFKIHLIAMPSNAQYTPSGFHFLAQTLKMLRPSENIQVECKYVERSLNPVHSFLEYTNLVHADALMTNMKKQKNKQGFTAQTMDNFFARVPYGRYPNAIFPIPW